MTLEPTDFYDDPAALSLYLAGRGLPDDGNSTIEEPQIRVMTGSVAGKRVLDLGCGDGRFASYSAASGAMSFHGVDGSEAMLSRARSAVDWPAATWECRNLEQWAAEPAADDLVISRMTLHYVTDLRRLFAEVRRSLDEGGAFVFSVEHPMVTSKDNGDFRDQVPGRWIVEDYFSQGARQCRWLGADVWKQHRTIADFIKALHAEGFQLEALSEGEPDPGRFTDPAIYRSRSSIPIYLLMKSVAV